MTWGSFRRDAIDLLSGAVRKVRHADRLRSFAACCGTPLFFEDHEDCEWIDVTISSLDQPEATLLKSRFGRKTGCLGFRWTLLVPAIDRAGNRWPDMNSGRARGTNEPSAGEW